MDTKRLNQLLDLFQQRRILVFGDFFLDQYLIIDDDLRETSLETGLAAHQVVAIRNSPGAAGVVTSNLRSLDVRVIALGMIGLDGRGYDLKKGLVETGVDISALFEVPNRLTPTYTKPMLRDADGSEVEIERLDIKNHTPLPTSLEAALIDRLKALVQQVEGVIIVDHVPEPDCGVITERVRHEIATLAQAYPQKFFIADSRKRMDVFRNVIIKCNLSEAQKAAHVSLAEGSDIDLASQSSRILSKRNQRPVIITMGDKGILVNADGQVNTIPAMPVSGPIDIVGAGDSTISGITAALCAGATLPEAALIGNLVASITIQQIGTTGTATRSQVKQRFEDYKTVVDMGKLF